jgi:excisionase family DNA binding protein
MNTLLQSEDPILTVRQVAEYLQLSRSKIYYLIQRRSIPFIRLGKNVRIRQSDLIKWLNHQTEKGD